MTGIAMPAVFLDFANVETVNVMFAPHQAGNHNVHHHHYYSNKYMHNAGFDGDGNGGDGGNDGGNNGGGGDGFSSGPDGPDRRDPNGDGNGDDDKKDDAPHMSSVDKPTAVTTEVAKVKVDLAMQAIKTQVEQEHKDHPGVKMSIRQKKHAIQGERES